MAYRVWELSIFLLIAGVSPAMISASPEVCPVPSVLDSVLGFLVGLEHGQIGVVEGDEAALQMALNLVHRNKGDYVAMLFYASWCPFSKLCGPNFQKLSSLFPSVRHFAFEESVIRPSILSRYGVHGFPTLFLLNSTVRVRYRGPRTEESLVEFYNNVTGVNPTSSIQMFMEKSLDPSKDDDTEAAFCPFSWAKSPDKLLQQDTYLALAICFLLMRMLYFLFPKLSACIQRAWRRQIRYASLTSVYDYFHVSVELKGKNKQA